MRQLFTSRLLILLCLPLLSSAQGKLDTYKKIADDIVLNYNNKEYEKIRDHLSGMVKLILTSSEIKKLFDGLHEEGGSIVQTWKPRMEGKNTIVMPLLFEKDSLKLDMILPFNADDKLIGLEFLLSDRVKYPKITDTTTIEDIVKPYMSKTENAGLTIGIYSDGKEQFFNYGKKEKGTGASPDSNTIYEIGSATKVFTGILLADLVKRGIVKYSDHLSKFLPDSIPPLKFENKEITLLDLATHRSGLPRVPLNIDSTMKDSLNPYASYSVHDLYAFLKNYKLERAPGKVYEYSNLGMGLLGEILAQQLKMTYEEAIKKEMLSKWSMNNTVITLSEEQKKRFAKGYNDKGNPTSYWDFETLEGAGALRSDAKDMIHFIQINLGQGEKALADVIREAQIKRTDETALGWHFMTINKEKVYWHNGGTFGFSSFIGFNKDKNVGVVVLSNSGNGVDEIGELVLEMLLKARHKETRKGVVTVEN